MFTRLRLSSQEWLICMAAWTSLYGQNKPYSVCLVTSTKKGAWGDINPKQHLHSQTQNLPLMSGFSVHHVDPLFLHEHSIIFYNVIYECLNHTDFRLRQIIGKIKLSVTLSNRMLQI